MKYSNSGFTLIELMIVVAIIGVLAAIAVPGFSKYIRDSKQSEATGMLRSVADGAVIFYNSEHVYDTLGLVIKKDFFPGCDPIGATAPTPCADVSNFGGVRVVGERISPNDPNLLLNEIPWTRLNVAINKPFLYVLTYTSDPTPASSSFEAHAFASLEADDDSELKISGGCTTGQMYISNIAVIKE